MPIEIREMVIKAILEDDNDPKSREWLNRVLDEAPMEQFLPGKNKKKARKAPRGLKADGTVGEEGAEQEPEWQLDGNDDEEEAEDEFMDSRESIIQECLDRVRELLEKHMMR